MHFELDHIFIWTTPQAPAADRLIDFGLTEGEPNIHPGQGTANRRFFFHNTMLELLWVHDAREAQNALTAPTRLYERWVHRDTVCPFGLCLRPSGHPGEDTPFAGWHYKPQYLPDTLSVLVGDNYKEPHEPWLFYLPFARRPDARPAREDIEHKAGLREISSLRLYSPATEPKSQTLRNMEKVNGIELTHGPEHLMEIGFDGQTAGASMDFRPHLPLRLKW